MCPSPFRQGLSLWELDQFKFGLLSDMTIPVAVITRLDRQPIFTVARRYAGSDKPRYSSVTLCGSRTRFSKFPDSKSRQF